MTKFILEIMNYQNYYFYLHADYIMVLIYMYSMGHDIITLFINYSFL